MTGSSLGAFCVALYAENYPEHVKALAPKATMISGQSSLESYDKNSLAEWEQTGFRIEESGTVPGLMKKLKWPQFREDIIKYDLLKKSDKLLMPVMLVIGSEDNDIRLNKMKEFYKTIPGKKNFEILQGAPHTFRDPKHLQELKFIFDNWIKGLD